MRENLRFRSAFWLSVSPSLIFSNQLVDDAAIDLLLDKPSLIEQRHHGPVGDGLVDRVFVDQAAEGRERVLLLLQQRRSGEAEIAGLRQEAAHLRGELAVAAIAAGLGAVAFIDQHEDIRRSSSGQPLRLQSRCRTC